MPTLCMPVPTRGGLLGKILLPCCDNINKAILIPLFITIVRNNNTRRMLVGPSSEQSSKGDELRTLKWGADRNEKVSLLNWGSNAMC